MLLLCLRNWRAEVSSLPVNYYAENRGIYLIKEIVRLRMGIGEAFLIMNDELADSFFYQNHDDTCKDDR